MTAGDLLDLHLRHCPLIAVIRGVTPDTVEGVASAIFDAGIRIIEVPLNSPDPIASIARLSTLLGDRALVGAGTVLTIDQVEQVRSAGGQLIVSPNTNPEIIAASVASGMVSCPGYFTPTEAFTALRAGAHALKFFPADAARPAVIKAQRAVLPRDAPLIVVGGVKPETMADWLAVGADGFGLGSGLFTPGLPPRQVGENAKAYVAGLAR